MTPVRPRGRNPFPVAPVLHRPRIFDRQPRPAAEAGDRRRRQQRRDAARIAAFVRELRAA